MASAVKVPLANLLNVMLASSRATRKECCDTSKAARQPTEEDKSVVKKSVYLNARAAQILAEIAIKDAKSETSVVNDAILFYNERGQFLEELIKRSVREAFQEFAASKSPVDEIQEANQMESDCIPAACPPKTLPLGHICRGILSHIEPAGEGLILVRQSQFENLVDESLLPQLQGLMGQMVTIGHIKGKWHAGKVSV